MAQQSKVYLDEQGNPVGTSTGTYLDEQGNPPASETAGALSSLSKAETIGAAPTRAQLAERMMKEPGQEGQFLRALQTGGAAPINEVNAAPDGLMRILGDVMDRPAFSLVRSAIKQPWAEAQRRAGIEGTDANTAANRLAKFIVDKGIWTANQAKKLGRASGQEVDTATAAAEAANPELVVDTAERIPQYLNDYMRRREGQLFPGGERRAVQAVGRRVVADSPLSRPTYQAPPPETLEEGLIRGMKEGVTAAENEGKRVVAPTEGHQFATEGGAFPQSSRLRELRTDIKPSELLPIIREKSYFNPQTSSPGKRTGERIVERAARDSFKEAVPDAATPLLTQGRAKDAERALTRSEWRNANRDVLGLPAIAGIANKNPGIGLLMQLIKEGQLGAGLLTGAAARGVRSESAPTLLQRLIAAGLGTAEPPQP